MRFTMLIFTITGIMFQAYSAYIFASTWLLSDEKINKIGGTYWGHNPPLINFLQSSRRTTYEGLFFLILGLILILIPIIVNSWTQKTH